MININSLPESCCPRRRLKEFAEIIKDSIDFERGQGRFEKDCFKRTYFIDKRFKIHQKILMN